MSPDLKSAFVHGVRTDYEKLRQQHAAQQVKPLLTLEQSRRRRTPIVWNVSDIPKPAFTGFHVLSSDLPSPIANRQSRISLPELVPYIDWSPFFHTWELRGRYPAILEEKPEARQLFADAQKLLQDIVGRNLLTARGVYGFFPANAVGDDVELYTDGSRSAVMTTFHFLRQQMEKPADQHNHCLADYISPKTLTDAATGQSFGDYLGAFAVSVGFGAEELCRQFEREHDDYNSIMTKALADRLAEAFAEYLHQRARRDWGYGRDENLTIEDLIRERYRGIRPAAGYPACPDHTEKLILWKLLDVEQNTGIRLTETGAMWPGASVSGLYFAHPESKYFAVGKIGHDQVWDYHLRKGMDLRAIERWLGPYLNYEPDRSASNQCLDPRQPGGLAECACGRSHAASASQG